MGFNLEKKKLPEGKTWFDLQIESTPKKYISQKKIAIIDCDGVITDGKSTYDKNGKAFKIYGAYDKQMMNFLSESFNWEYIFISDDKAGMDITKNRVQHLIKSNNKISFEPINAKDRFNFIKMKKINYNISIFVGDSLSDIPCMSEVDYSGCPNNSSKQVKQYCDFSSELNGADGALADILWNLHLYISNQYKIERNNL